MAGRSSRDFARAQMLLTAGAAVIISSAKFTSVEHSPVLEPVLPFLPVTWLALLFGLTLAQVRAERIEERVASGQAAPSSWRTEQVAKLVAATVLGGALAGLLAATSTGAREAEPHSIANGGVGIRYPANWHVSDVPASGIPGLHLRNVMQLRPDAPRGARMVVGISSAGGPALLDSELLERLVRKPSRRDRRWLGRLQSYRYADLSLDGSTRRLSLFVAPTTAGVVTVACSAEPKDIRRFSGACERVARTIHLVDRSIHSFALGPRLRYAIAIDATLKRAGAARVNAHEQLGAATTAEDQAAAADDVAHALARAAQALADMSVSPAESSVHAGITNAVMAMSRAYARLARTARAGQPAAFSRARHDAHTAEKRLRRALGRLAALGYEVRQPAG